MAREKGMGNLQREKSGRWTMRVGIKGKRYCRSARTKDRDQAERVLQRFLAPLGLGEQRLPLADVWFEYVKSPNRNELAKATMDGKRQVWMHFAKWMEHFYLPVKDLGGVTSDMVAEYLVCLRADLCATTYNNRVCILREIFRVLAQKAGLEEDPWEGVRLRPDDSHSRRELTMDELKRLLKAAAAVGSAKCEEQSAKVSAECRVRSAKCEEGTDGASHLALCTSHLAPRTSHYNEWHLLILIGIYTGLRLGDCCRLDWSQINLAQGVIQLVPEKTKRHHRRIVTIPIHPALGAALLESAECNVRSAKSENADASHFALSTLHFTGPVLPRISEMYTRTRSRVSDRLCAIFRAAHIETSVRIEGRKHKTPEATFHSLRHTFVSFAANAGVPLHVVQSIVGHESTAMTRHYYHENIVALKSAVNAIPSLL